VEEDTDRNWLKRRKLTEVVKFTCGRLAAGGRTAGVNRVVVVRVRLIGPVVRVNRVIRAVGVIRVVVYAIVDVRPAGPARRAVVAR